jgi:hypothetical protein
MSGWWGARRGLHKPSGPCHRVLHPLAKLTLDESYSTWVWAALALMLAEVRTKTHKDTDNFVTVVNC